MFVACGMSFTSSVCIICVFLILIVFFSWFFFCFTAQQRVLCYNFMDLVLVLFAFILFFSLFFSWRSG